MNFAKPSQPSFNDRFREDRERRAAAKRAAIEAVHAAVNGPGVVSAHVGAHDAPPVALQSQDSEPVADAPVKPKRVRKKKAST